MNIFHSYSFKSLKKNKIRTLVTIIGIILSVAMITAVTTMIATVRNYGISYIIYREGNWHVLAGNVDSEKRKSLYEDERVAAVYDLQDVGYAYLADGVNKYKPYLCIQAMSETFKANMPVHLTEGRMPENDREILIPEHVYTNGGVKLQTGDTLELEIGFRDDENGTKLWQNSMLYTEEDAEGNEKSAEQLQIEFKRAYTIVGFYERPAFEDYSAPGYTVLTMQSEDFGYSVYDCYLVMKHPDTAFGLQDELSMEDRSICNNELLRFYGLSMNDGFNAILYGMGSILIGIIVAGSIALIYNAFAISISERTKQFGLLSSAGATKKQMKKTICFEGLVLCLIGIPLGVLSGILGIGVTLFCLKSPLETFMGSTYGRVEMQLHVSYASVTAAVVVSIVTVLISAYLPMRRALKVSAIDAVRQRNDIKLSPGNVRIPGFMHRLFGVEGMIAYKNCKRNKKQYRATVISLAMSIILFISAGSFSEYLFGGLNGNITTSFYDICITADQESIADSLQVYDKVCEIEGVTPYYHYIFTSQNMAAAESDVTEEALRLFEGNRILHVYFNFLPEDIYHKLVMHYELDEEKYADLDKVPAIVLNDVSKWNEEGKQIHVPVLKDTCSHLQSIRTGYDEEKDININAGNPIIRENDREFIIADGYTEKRVALEDYAGTVLQIGDIVDNDSYEGFMLDNNMEGFRQYSREMEFIYPLAMADAVLSQLSNKDRAGTMMYFQAEDHKKAYDIISILLQSYDNIYAYDAAEAEEQDRAALILVNVFCYGFIILISLISAANVFNTISTNMSLRKREFAMLKSYGMSEKGFMRMMNFECILYGVKGLCYGLVISVFLVMWMYFKAMGSTLENFYMPWQYIVIAVICVFAIVYSTMVYGRVKLKEENIVDALKNENQ